MRGEICIGFASILSFVSLLLLIFVHIGQINTSSVPRKISMVKVDMSQYGAFVSASIFNNVTDLYTTNASAPLNQQAGLRDSYEFGLYSYCAYVSDGGGLCSNRTTAHSFKPFEAVSGDMPQLYRVISGTSIIPLNLTFKDSKYTGQTSKAAYWMILLGTICAALTLITGFAKNNLTFFVSTIFSVAGSLFLLIGSSLWTVLIKKTEAINDSGVEIFVSEGTGLFLLWASFACLFVSIIPSVLSCCTYR